MQTSVGGCMLVVLSALLCSIGTAEAQSTSDDSGSQRILPLPEGKLSDVQTQMQLLQRLRSLVASSDGTEKSELPSPVDSLKIDDKQLEQLQQALKKLQEQLPPGVTPPDLDSIPKEQLDEAMANPAMQQQLKKMLEQFSKDGLLPKNNGDASDSPLPPVPRRRGQSPVQPLAQQPEQVPPSVPPGEKSWESLKDAMKKLSEIAQGGNNQSPQNDDGGPGVHAPEDGDDASPRTSPKRGSGDERQPRTDQPRTEQPRTEQPRADQPRTDRKDAEPNDVEPREGDPVGDEAGNRETQQPSLQAFQDLLERFKDSQRNQPPSGDGTSGSEPDETRLPEVRPGMRSPRTEEDGSAPAPDASKRVIRRPDRATPVEPPANSGPKTSEQGEVFPPAEMPSSNQPPSSAGKSDLRVPQSNQQPQDSSGNDSSEKPMPSVSEFLKEQFRRGFPTPDTKEGTPDSKSSGGNERPQSSMPGDSRRNDSAQPGSPGVAPGTNQSKIDIQRELQKRGVRGTLDKLIQNAKEETKARQLAQKQVEQQSQLDSLAGQPGNPGGLPGTEPGQPGNTTGPGGQNGTPGDAGLQKSLTDLLSGMDDNMEDIVKDAKFKDQSGESPRSDNSAWQQAPRDSDSRVNKWNDAASDFLSDLSKAPSAPAAPRSSSAGGSPISADAPLAIGSFFLVGLGLLGIAAVAAFLMRRPLLKLVSDVTGIASPGRVRQPSEIRSREDVISAFHELALNPAKLVESWWTHRAAATKLAAESPQQGHAVQTLAEIYEQARYLPDDVELPADKIQSARTALAECR